MKRITLLLAVMILSFISAPLHANEIAEEMDRVAADVAKLKLGFGDYVLGQGLTSDQKKKSTKMRSPKAHQGSYKFKDGELNVVVNQANDVIIGLYKQYPDASMGQIKSVIGDLMFRFGEPTTMAHDKLIYWGFDQNGPVTEDDIKLSKKNGGAGTIATIKFSSNESIAPDKRDKDGKKLEETEEKKSSVYVMITSDPLSKLFLTLHSEKQVKPIQ